MTFEQAMQLASVLGGIVASAFSARSGHRQVLERLQNYVPLSTYQPKISALHDTINAQAIKIAQLEKDLEHLRGAQ